MASQFKSHEVEDGSVMIRGMASTNYSDRAGDVIAAEAWSKGGLENFKNNPVVYIITTMINLVVVLQELK